MRNVFYRKIGFLAVIVLLQGCLLFQSPNPATPPAPDISESWSMQAAYHYSLGVLNLLDENIEEAIAEFEKVREFDPKSPVLATELAILYSEKGAFGKSLELLQDALKRHPRDVEIRFLLAGLFASRKDYVHAIREYRTVIALDPKHTLAYLYLGILYAEQKDYQNALDTLEKLSAVNPDHAVGHYYLAKVLIELGQDEQAEKELKRALALRPSFESAMADLGLLYEKQKKFPLAIGVYEDFSKAYPSRVKVRIRLGDLLLREKRHEEAEQVLRAVLQQNADNKEILLNIGLVFLERERHEQAIDLFGKLLASYPDDQKIRYLLATAYSEKSLPRQALDMFQQIPPDSEFFANARIQAAVILKNEGNTDGAAETVRDAIARKRDAPGLYLFLSALYDGKKDYAQAEKILREGLSILPESTEILYGLGALFEKTGRFEDGIQQMRLILAIHPDHADALNFIGYSYADRNLHLSEAEEMIKKALRLKPGSAHIIDSLGWVYFRQNKLDQAIHHLLEAARLQPDDATISEHLGDAYVKAGQFKEALAIYQQSLKLNPGSDTLPPKIRDLLKK
jgi:tetratricopeptide (TPR) repeat protein